MLGSEGQTEEGNTELSRASEQREVAGGEGEEVGLSKQGSQKEKKRYKMGVALKTEGRVERDGCNTCDESGEGV